MTKDIRDIHEEVFKMLEEIHHYASDLYFSLRKSNRGGKLDQGFWFHGTDDFLAISFWSGLDWKARIPNISFIVNRNGSTYLTLTASDSRRKLQFLETHFSIESDYLKVREVNNGFSKAYIHFGPDDYLESLRHFLADEKVHIDNVVREYGNDLSNDPSDIIGFIGAEDFEANIRKVQQYRFYYIDQGYQSIDKSQLAGFQIKNFGPILNIDFVQIQRETQWIFLIGENGTGKTSLLKAIGCGLTHTKFPVDEATEVIFHLFSESNIKKFIRHGNSDVNKRKPLVSGFCSYGAARLRTSSRYKSTFSFTKSLGKAGLTSSLFDVNTILIDIDEQFRLWSRNPQMTEVIKRRRYFVKELLIDLLPNIYNIEFSGPGTGIETLYIEKDEQNNVLSPVTFEMLASGLKSLIAMIGDMMMRLFNQQPHIIDPSELDGVVLIDEIDIHLHPKLQKSLVEQLTVTFPKVQFIATSHSPIPLLGAPLNSQFFKVERSSDKGVMLTDVSEIRVDRLLPNTILSSELFGMNQLFSREFTESKPRTEDTFNELLLNDLVKAELREIAHKLRNKQ